MDRLNILKPNDMHLHLRDGDAMAAVLPFSAKQMGFAVIMPNLKPPVIQVADALSYQNRILANLPSGSQFKPLMTLYLTDHTSVDLVKAAKAAGIVAFKLYPAGATTNSDSGVTDLFNLKAVLETMADEGVPLLVHGEVTDPSVDIFDRESEFIERILKPLLDIIPDLKVVFEHITTEEAAKFVLGAGDNVAATVTPQHLLLNRNDMLVGGIRPHHYCLPILKREHHRIALLDAVTGKKSYKFFLGTDSAPHAQNVKENACGCAGVFSAHVALELYAEAFDSVDAIDKLEAFASINGAQFYGLPLSTERVTLVRQVQNVPSTFSFGNEALIPMRAGGQIGWTIV